MRYLFVLVLLALLLTACSTPSEWETCYNNSFHAAKGQTSCRCYPCSEPAKLPPEYQHTGWTPCLAGWNAGWNEWMNANLNCNCEVCPHP